MEKRVEKRSLRHLTLWRDSILRFPLDCLQQLFCTVCHCSLYWLLLLSLLAATALFTTSRCLLQLSLLPAAALFTACYCSLYCLLLLSLVSATALFTACYCSRCCSCSLFFTVCYCSLYCLLLPVLYNRFVMTKIHPLAFGGKLDGAADGSISARLRALQFLTADDLNVATHARDDTVLALAQV